MSAPSDAFGEDRGGGSLLGDLARALDALHPEDEAARAAILRQLGLESRGTGRGGRGAGDVGAPVPEANDTMWQQAAERLAAEGARRIEEARRRQPGILRKGRRTAEPVQSTLTPTTTTTTAVEPPAWLDDVPPLSEARAVAGPPLEPLLVQRWTPAILSAAVAQDADDGPIDVLRLVDQVARGELVRQFPQHPRLTLGAGAQVLLDVGESLLPFREDCAVLIELVRRIVGEDRVDVLRFAGAPTRGAGTGAAWTWRPYEPPARQCVVLAVTMLGAGHGRDEAGASEWIALAEQLRAVSCPLVALVPTAAGAVAPGIRRVIRVLEWDRRTTLAAAMRAVHRSAR